MLDLLGVGVPSGPGGTSGKSNAEQERPSPAARQAKTGHIRPDGRKCAEPGGSPRGS
jgi:hypothetical protein